MHVAAGSGVLCCVINQQAVPGNFSPGQISSKVQISRIYVHIQLFFWHHFSYLTVRTMPYKFEPGDELL
jgi:hypothetical protein